MTKPKTKKARTLYQVDITRSGKWWAIEVPELPGTYSQAKRIDQVEAMAREAIAMMTDADETSFDIEIQVGPEVTGLMHALDASVEAASRARAEEAACRRQVIEDLRNELGLPNRDVAKLLGLSHQRVAQILKEQPTKVA